jgi:hypothetical protein
VPDSFGYPSPASSFWASPTPAAGLAAALKFETPTHKKQLPKLHVFVDEYGDRNFKNNRESDWFTMTALIVEQEHVDHMRAVIAGMRTVYKIPPGGKLHWVEHFRKRQPVRRQTALSLLTSIPNVKVVNVLLHKPSIGGGARMRNDHARTYNMMTEYLLERVARAARDWPGGERIAKLYLGVVGGVDHRETLTYLHARACMGDARVPYGNLLWPLRWFNSAEWEGLQAADIFSGFLTSGVVDRDTSYFPHILKFVCKDSFGHHFGEGMKVFPNEAIEFISTEDWWRVSPGARWWKHGMAHVTPDGQS